MARAPRDPLWFLRDGHALVRRFVLAEVLGERKGAPRVPPRQPAPPAPFASPAATAKKG